MASDTLGYMPLSKRRVVRLEKQSKVLLAIGFLAGVVVYWIITYIRRANSLGPLVSAMDNYQRMCVPFSFR